MRVSAATSSVGSVPSTQAAHTKKKSTMGGRFKNMAERMRFELTVRVAPYTHFPGVLLQPLGHLSVCPYYICIYCVVIIIKIIPPQALCLRLL